MAILTWSGSNALGCLSSPLFTFTVGANKKELTVHSSALAGLSQSLNTLINGKMKEAKTGHAVWSEVDVDTFARLCEYVYLRNYTPPSYRLIDGVSSHKGHRNREGKEETQ